MKNFLILTFAPFLCFCNSFVDTPISSARPLNKDFQKEVVINNRILARVNGKAISLLDVVKEMDVYLNRYYSKMADSAEGRYQFYMATWRDVLEQMVTSELMLADAESREIKVTDGEIREVIQERFGPNVMLSLSKIGLTYDEARDMVYKEMIVERMRWFRVNSKAQHQVNLQDIKQAYQDYCIAHPSKNIWKYQIVTVRAEQKERGKTVADLVYQLLSKDKEELAKVTPAIQEQFPDVQISLSQNYEFEDKNLSEKNRTILSTVQVGSTSLPIEQKAKDESLAYRLFVLKDHIEEPAPAFESVVNEIKEELLQKAVGKELSSYLAKLRHRFGYNETSTEIPEGYVPFVLK